MKVTKEHTVLPNLLNREFKQNITRKVLLNRYYILKLYNEALIHSDQGDILT